MKRVGSGVYRGRLSTNGRLVLPHELRDRFAVGPGDWVTLKVVGGRLVLTFGQDATDGGEDAGAGVAGTGRVRNDFGDRGDRG